MTRRTEPRGGLRVDEIPKAAEFLPQSRHREAMMAWRKQETKKETKKKKRFAESRRLEHNTLRNIGKYRKRKRN